MVYVALAVLGWTYEEFYWPSGTTWGEEDPLLRVMVFHVVVHQS
jgi:hypothetical protein